MYRRWQPLTVEAFEIIPASSHPAMKQQMSDWLLRGTEHPLSSQSTDGPSGSTSKQCRDHSTGFRSGRPSTHMSTLHP